MGIAATERAELEQLLQERKGIVKEIMQGMVGKFFKGKYEEVIFAHELKVDDEGDSYLTTIVLRERHIRLGLIWERHLSELEEITPKEFKERWELVISNFFK